MPGVLSSPQLLVADDDGALVETLQVTLEPYFPTIAVRSGEEAVEVLRQAPVHLVLIDMYLGETTGIEVIRYAKELDRQRPCILMSGDLDDEVRQKARVARADHVLSKPISRQQLLSIIRGSLGIVGADDADLMDLA
jgi:CheY-like chemotaxis protein